MEKVIGNRWLISVSCSYSYLFPSQRDLLQVFVALEKFYGCYYVFFAEP